MQSPTQLQQYCIAGRSIYYSQSERDLGIIVGEDLSWSDHYRKISAIAYSSLHLIRHTLTSSSPSIYSLKKTLYITLVRSHLSYCCQLWRPRLVRDIISLERIQKRATLNNYTTNYRERLLSQHLLPIMSWFELHDLMFLIKCFNDPEDNINIHKYISFVTTSTRARTNNRLKPNFVKTSTAKHFYFNRVIKLWNSIPSNTLDLSLSYNTLKVHLYNYLWSSFVNSFDPDITFHHICPCSRCSNI